MFLPPDLPKNDADPEKVPLKTILMWNGVRSWGVQGGRGEFLKQNCPVSNCALVSDKSKQDSADLILFKVFCHFLCFPTLKTPLCFVLIKISTLINKLKGKMKSKWNQIIQFLQFIKKFQHLHSTIINIFRRI